MKIYIHSTTEIKMDPRPRRTVDYLRNEKFQVHEVLYTYSKKMKIIKFIEFIFWALSKKKRSLIQTISLNTLTILEKNQNDYHLVEDPLILPSLFDELEFKSNIVVDLREYHPKSQRNVVFYLTHRFIYLHIYRNYLTKLENVLTVSEAHRDILERRFGVKSKVVLSAPVLVSEENVLVKTNKQNIDFVYLGLANTNRGIRLICKSFEKLEDTNVYLYLSGDPNYIQKLRQEYKGKENIKIYEMVDSTQVIDTLKKYDVGICFFKRPWNTRNSLPNKFFSYIHADLALLVYENSQMAGFVNSYRIGRTVKHYSVTSFREAVSSFSIPLLREYQKNSSELKLIFNFQNEAIKLGKIFK
jgi:hypothetical protein